MTDKRQVVTGFLFGGACGILTACASSAPPVPAAAVPPPPPVPIDGTYGGMMQLDRGDAMNCGDQIRFTLRVTNHAINYRLSQPQADWKPVIVFSAPIASDGSFNAQSGTAYMRGHISGGNMQGELAGDICSFTFNADRGGI